MAWNRLSRCDVDSAATVCFGEYRFNGVEPPESMRLFGKDSVQEEVMGCFNGVEPPESMRLAELPADPENNMPVSMAWNRLSRCDSSGYSFCKGG